MKPGSTGLSTWMCGKEGTECPGAGTPCPHPPNQQYTGNSMGTHGTVYTLSGLSRGLATRLHCELDWPASQHASWPASQHASRPASMLAG